MSRIGKKPINLPDKVKVVVDGGQVRVDGPKGSLAREVVSMVRVRVDGGKVLVEREGEDNAARARHGLMRALVQNMVTGVSAGFERRLEIVGTGYKAEVAGKNLELSLGYSHKVIYPVPQGITVEVEKLTRIVVKGADRQLVGESAAKIRSFRAPDVYKGKGVRYADEKIKLKAGKAAGK